jgi:hypothetical protein
MTDNRQPGSLMPLRIGFIPLVDAAALLVAVGKAAAPARPSDRFPVEQTVIWNKFE